MSVTIRGKLPNNDADGLQKAANALRVKRNRDEVIVVAMRLVCTRVIEKLHDPDDPVQYELGVASVEIIDEDGDRSFVSSVMNAAYERRTGKAPLPFGTMLETDTEEDEPD
jgi:hypothetical protein